MEKHTCITDDGGTPNRRCYACIQERSMEPDRIHQVLAWRRGVLTICRIVDVCRDGKYYVIRVID
jgi:hypothetical protein